MKMPRNATSICIWGTVGAAMFSYGSPETTFASAHHQFGVALQLAGAPVEAPGVEIVIAEEQDSAASRGRVASGGLALHQQDGIRGLAGA